MKQDKKNNKWSLIYDKRGYSDVIGYALTFGITLILISIVFASATGYVDDTQSTQELQAGEYMFSQIDDHVREVQLGQDSNILKTQVPSGTLQQTSETSITIQPDTGGTDTITTRPLRYSTQKGDVVTYNGVFLSQRQRDVGVSSSSISKVHPETYSVENMVWLVPSMSEKGVIISEASSNPVENTFVVEKEDVKKPPRVFEYTSDVTITVDSTIGAGWEPYFERSKAFENVRTGGGGSVIADVNLDGDETFTVVSTEMNVTLA